MGETMRSVMDAARLGEREARDPQREGANINQVVATITKVADQTNLLSLNAAIEAEEGRAARPRLRGRRDRDPPPWVEFTDGGATYDIEQTVKEIQSAVSAGVMGMDKFSEEVRRGMLDVQQVGGQLSQIIAGAAPARFQMVNEGMQTQRTAPSRSRRRVAIRRKPRADEAESLRQSSQAIDGDLTLVANQLRTSVSRFKVDATRADPQNGAHALLLMFELTASAMRSTRRVSTRCCSLAVMKAVPVRARLDRRGC